MLAPNITPTDPKTQRLAAFVRHVGEILDIDITVILWDDTAIPLCKQPTSDLAVKIYDPGVITSLLRAPKLWTAIELLLNGRIRILNGLFFDFEPRRQALQDKIRARVWRRISKVEAVKALAPFYFGDKNPPTPKLDFAGAIADRVEQGRDDKALVQFHYDLSNEFYALFLDPKMVYSCAYYPTWESSLEDAQTAKLDIVCRKLQLKPNERFLDIGCGWGGLVIHAAQHYGVQAHGVTLSQAQFDFAQARIAELGLADKITIELKDYRDLTGEYDKIASVGMFEHVGVDDRSAYFTRMRDLLRPRGIMLHHAVTRPAKRTDRAFRRKRPEYAAIVNYIFPGSDLDHIGNTLATIERHGFEVHDVEAWREHYARTTRAWCERLYANRAQAEAEIGAPRTRLWLLYLAGCSLGFERGGIGICQTVATRRARGPSQLPQTRADLYA